LPASPRPKGPSFAALLLLLVSSFLPVSRLSTLLWVAPLKQRQSLTSLPQLHFSESFSAILSEHPIQT
jgi:hypothetical protein